MFKPFSKRHSPPPTLLRDDLPRELRLRLVEVFRAHCQPPRGDLLGLLADVDGLLLREYGWLHQASYDATRHPHPTIDHFLHCDDLLALDFIEACFHSASYTGEQAGVDEINAIFDEVGLAYQLTPFSRIPLASHEGPPSTVRGGKQYRVVRPTIIRRDHQMMHREVVEPALQLLRDPRLHVANDEMLRAHAEFRAGKYAECISLAGSAFESVMRTICSEHGWWYDPNADSCGALVAALHKNSLFPPFYVEILKAVCTLRNKLSASHGRGPAIQHPPSKEQAAHLLHLASAYCLLLCSLAGFR